MSPRTVESVLKGIFTGKSIKAARVAQDGKIDETQLVKPEGHGNLSYGTTRSWWLQRQSKLFNRVLTLLEETGNTEIKSVICETKKCVRLMNLELVRQDPTLMQVLVERYDGFCDCIVRATEDVPRGEALLDDLAQCCEVLMQQPTTVDSATKCDKPHSRPEWDVDLSFVAVPLKKGNIQQYTERSEATAGDIVDFGKHAITKDMDAEASQYNVIPGLQLAIQFGESEKDLLLPKSAPMSADLRKSIVSGRNGQQRNPSKTSPAVAKNRYRSPE